MSWFRGAAACCVVAIAWIAGCGEARPIAALDGRPVQVDEFRSFVDAARGPGYRPATRREAERLLDAQLRSMVLDREVVERGHSLDRSGRRAALAELAAERGVAFARDRVALQRRALLGELLETADVRIDAQLLAAEVRSEAPRGPARPPSPWGAGR